MTDTSRQQKRAYAPRMAPEERREQILDAVLRVIVSHGVHKVSMDSVAKEAGVARPVLYGHFKDSDALLRASLEREEAGALAQLNEVLPAPGDGSPVDAAVSSVRRYLAAVLAAPDRWRAILTLVDSSTPTFQRHLERGRAAVVAVLEDLVRWAVTDGLDDDTDVELLARMLLAFLFDAARLALTQPDDYPPERIEAFAERVIARHLGTSCTSGVMEPAP